ncbi:Nucleolar protein 10 [Galdieria sulphuraria]|nr:Nucleolar protein 10 [Galdieria sulphuraria]
MPAPFIIHTSNGHKIYHVNNNTSQEKPDWFKNASEKKRKREQVRRGGVEILQDFEFPTFCSKVKQSLDGNYIVAIGGYPPQVKVYDVHQVSLKFERHLDYDMIDFQILEEDWKKLVFLCTDRRLEFHSQYGSYYRARIPRNGRDLMIDRHTADLHIVTSGPEVYRFNLDRGQFMSPWETSLSEGIQVCGLNPVYSMMAYGGEDGCLEIWDPRCRERAAKLDIATFISVSDEYANIGISSLRFDEMDGISMAIGMASGHCLLFDIRSSQPLVVKNQGYGLPVEGIKFHSQTRNILSHDKKSIKIWQRGNGHNFATMELNTDIHHTCLIGDSGLLFAATEDRPIHSYYIPSLGTAPKWCSFLDNLTEELEEKQQNVVYENYQFVTRNELESIGLQQLIGSDLLRPYMHGFFIDLKLYRKAKDAADPQAYEEYRKQKLQEKLEKLRSSRIAKRPKYPKVNKETWKQQPNSSILQDSRFQAMFENPDFEIQQDNERYRQIHSSKSHKTTRKPNPLHSPKNNDIIHDANEDHLVTKKEQQYTKEEQRLPLLARLSKGLIS